MIEGGDKAPASDAAFAFDAMRRQLALLGSAVAGFAARREELQARDYAPDLARLIERQDKIGAALRTLADRPALALTPETLGHEITRAGKNVREADHRAMQDNAARLDLAIRRIDAVVESALTADKQKLWMLWAAAGGMVLGILLWSVLPGGIARAVPESWHWPERMAADMLGTDVWNAGERLLQLADTQRWEAHVAADRLVKDNAAALAACRKKLQRSSSFVSCKLVLSR